MIFATDLDRTMIYSEKFINNENRTSVIGYQDGKIKSYMTRKAKILLDELKEKITIIPCTTRARDQYERVPYFQDCKYAICANGAIILKDGEEDPQWKAVMQENLLMCIREMETYKKDLEKESFVRKGVVKVVDGYFLFFRVEDMLDCLKYLEMNVDKNKFYYSISTTKVYIFPKFVSKEHSLRYLTDRIGDKDIVVAGDNDVDFKMMKLATKGAFVPVYGTATIENSVKDVTLIHDSGVLAGEIILQEVKNILDKEETKDVN